MALMLKASVLSHRVILHSHLISCPFYQEKGQANLCVLCVRLSLEECFVPTGQGKNLLQQFLQTFCPYGTAFVPDTSLIKHIP